MQECIRLNIILCHCLESTGRVACTVPRWVIEGFKVYYLEPRPHFISSEGLKKYKRMPTEGEQTEVTTEPFFVNSKGNADFRVKCIVDQFTSAVCMQTFFINPIMMSMK